MFSLNIALGNISWRLLFRDEEKAVAAVNQLDAQTGADKVQLLDDFGQSFSGYMQSIHGYMLEDMEKTKLAHAELFLHGKRTENLAAKMAQADKSLHASNLMNNGPAVLSPMGGYPRN